MLRPTLAAFILALSAGSAAAEDLPVLKVLTYDSFIPEWGPGPAIEAAFEETCGCDLVFEAPGDGAAVLAALTLAGESSDASVVLGLDSNLMEQARATGLFAERTTGNDFDLLPIPWDDPVFQPFDWGYFAFVHRTDLEEVPGDLRALAESDLTVVIQDPRSSTPGLGLLMWAKAVYGDEAWQFWEALSDNIVTVTPGWSEAYGLFLEGEADMVLSYTTSPAYHRIAEEDDGYAFALFADGFWSALILHIWPGFGLAGTFMVGLRILTDRMEGPAQTRATSVYTSGYAAGMSLSFFAAGEIAATVGWRWAFGAAALGAVAAFAVATVAARGPAPMRPERSGAHFLDYRPVMRNREALGYILAYGAHVWELFGARAWIVAFLTYAMAGATAEQRWIAPTVVAALFTLVGVPASIVGNELCLRLGRRATLTGIMVVSAAVSAAVGFTADWGYGAVALVARVYGMVLMADSASLTAGTVLAADPRHRGATMAMHSAVGFFGAFAAPVVFGAVLDAAGNGVAGWGLGFATLGVACALGPFALLALVRKDRG